MIFPKKQRPGEPAIEHLGQRELRLHDRELTPIALGAMAHAKAWRRRRSHLRTTASIFTASS